MDKDVAVKINKLYDELAVTKGRIVYLEQKLNELNAKYMGGKNE